VPKAGGLRRRSSSRSIISSSADNKGSNSPGGRDPCCTGGPLGRSEAGEAVEDA
jgi:hypothetical protein